MDEDLPERRAAEGVAFLRAAAAELRRIAERAPEIGEELRRIADELDADADGLAKLIAGLPSG